MVTVSSIFSPALISSIQWPLGPGCSPPLYFEPLQELKKIRKSKQQSSADDAGPMEEIVSNIIPYTNMFSDLPSQEEAHFGTIALALLCLGHGYVDECHNLVTPMSWPDDIHFANGPSIYHQVSPNVKVLATYTHSLVHRREAFNVGEFGMVGFANANYWSNAVRQQEVATSFLPHEKLQSAILQLVTSSEVFSNSSQVQSWCQRHISTTKDYFDSTAVHELCAQVLRDQEGVDETFRTFAEQVAATEVRILLESALEKVSEI